MRLIDMASARRLLAINFLILAGHACAHAQSDSMPTVTGSIGTGATTFPHPSQPSRPQVLRLPAPTAPVTNQPTYWRAPVIAEPAEGDSLAMIQPGESSSAATVARPASFRVQDVLQSLSGESASHADLASLGSPWWQTHVQQSIDPYSSSMPVTLDRLIQMALEHSAQIRVYQKTPQIRKTAIDEAVAAFDWNRFLDATWSDISDPVGSSLTVGGDGTRFNDHNIITNLGARRRNAYGGEVELNQRFGHQNTNSQFFQPNDQGTARLTLGYTQPLMRGRGVTYNRSLIVLASIDAKRATDEYKRQLQQHLLEIARAYWTLYLERTTLTQKVSLFLKTKENAEQLRRRQAIDAQKSQVIQATAALESRKSDLIRARAAVKNAETRLRALINDPALDESTEIIPLDLPTLEFFSPKVTTEFATAIQNRPEINAAIKEIRSASVRLNMAKHEMLPVLNLVTDTYVSGLQGESQVGDAWLDQFREGSASYTVGLEYEAPVGRRAASAGLQRRKLESIQLSEKYRSTLELVKAEVEVAVREVITSHRELSAKDRSRKAAEAEAETLEARWRNLGGRGNNASLMFESLIQAQQRVTEAEHEVSKAMLTYSLALINLRHANGTLLQMDLDR